jgi:ribosomal-protein-alanine N-acetyltransferase
MDTVLESERLFLREFEPDDAQLLSELNGSPDVVKHVLVRKEPDLDASVQSVLRCSNYYHLHPGLGVWPTILKDGNRFIGWTCLKHLESTTEIEIGYRYLREFWNRGFCTEISKNLLTYGFEKLNLPKIVAVVHPENLASLRVLEKLGMQSVTKAQYYGQVVKYYEKFNPREH